MTARILSIALALGTLGLGSVAVAQDGGFSSELERVASAGPEEKVAYVQTAVAEITDSFTAIDAMYDEAKSSNDGKAIQCVSSRHAAVKALQSVTEQAERDMVRAAGEGNIDRADHEFRKVAVALQRTRMLHAEAERCMGGQELADGETSVQILDDDTDVVFEDGGFAEAGPDIGFDPPDVSPFR